MRCQIPRHHLLRVRAVTRQIVLCTAFLNIDLAARQRLGHRQNVCRLLLDRDGLVVVA